MERLPDEVFLVIADYLLTPVKGVYSPFCCYRMLFDLALVNKSLYRRVCDVATHIATLRNLAPVPYPWTPDKICHVLERGQMRQIREMAKDLNLVVLKDDGAMWTYAYSICYPHKKVIVPLNLKLHVLRLRKRIMSKKQALEQYPVLEEDDLYRMTLYEADVARLARAKVS